ncbi:radical SAM family heme chaperone HemW [Saccharopolyspora sp. K220]|uniref:radical SAM family heme chaperone HemW n=1 Tax=Saccharopolyspora soli TaxID=2926618 RepID=UPI001F58F731|nr:radical SAM family heme chaperone HemW [Saccharopolyspora soli]MCI2420961.1 radical SAM family heme chaperone HemW [Saccharopolyspora soli]
MPAQLPTGEPAPVDGSLPPEALTGLGSRPFGVYVHVPFCATRCGYCDFNTYTADELGSSASFGSWLDGLRAELELGARALAAGDRPVPVAQTVFVGGGTPSLLGARRLGEVLAAIRGSFGLSSAAEITTESNPESTSPEFFAGIREAGFTRVSLGMQSVAEHVLRVLDRRHTPGRAVAAAGEAREAGFEHVNLDLIYGTPGETNDDLRASLDAVLATGVDHVSAYALIVEDGTAMARKVRRGELPMPDDDVLADRYELIDGVLGEAGLGWYEVSNWARDDQARCHHNLGYWQGGDWWGAGPGAHSHVGGVRWWNVKHPARYTALLAEGKSPAAGRERLSAEDQRIERIMLELRLTTGLPVEVLDESGRLAAKQAVADGLLRRDALTAGRCVLTDRGRLLADGVVQHLIA